MRDDGCHLMSLSSCPMFVRVFAFVACFLSCHSTHNVRTRKEREIGCISVVVSMPLHRNFINVALRLLWEIVGLVLIQLWFVLRCCSCFVFGHEMKKCAKDD